RLIALGTATLGRGACRGPQRVACGLKALFADALARIDITAQTPIRRMPQRPLARELGVLDLAHELGRAPVRCRVRAHITCERRLRHLALLESREQLVEGALVVARP